MQVPTNESTKADWSRILAASYGHEDKSHDEAQIKATYQEITGKAAQGRGYVRACRCKYIRSSTNAKESQSKKDCGDEANEKVDYKILIEAKHVKTSCVHA